MDFPAPPFRASLWLWLLLVPAVLAGLVGAYVVLAPTSLAYELTPERLVVEAQIGLWDQGRSLARADLPEPKRLKLASRGRRVVGSGLPGFCVGRWRYPQLGDVWQATDCGESALLLDTPGEPIVISPVERDAFVTALTTGATGRFEVPSAPRGPLMGVGLLALAPIGVVAWLVRRVARPMIYTVAGGILTVPAHFSPVRVHLRGARVERGPLGRAWRLAGSSMPGFALGAFRAGGRRIHVAATGRHDGVWIHGDRTVYVSPADVDAFVAAVEAAAAG